MSADGATKIAMRGAGYYSSNTVGAKAVIDKVADRIVEAIADMPASAPGQPLALADSGAADGGTSIDLMRRAVAAIRAREHDRQITIVYTDLPHNDFAALFRLTQGLLGPRTQPPLAETPGLFIFGSGTSFYRQIVPDGALSLGFSATAMHWLSARPCMIRDHVQAVGAAPEERELFRAQSLKDWETILLNRARELRTGGRLVLANFCVDEAGRYLGATVGVNMFDEFARQWSALLAVGRINEAEDVHPTFKKSNRTPTDFAGPFRDPHSACSKAGLRLENLSTKVTPCPYAADFLDL